MADIQKAKSSYEFIGKAWVNEVKSGAKAGTKFISVSLGKDVGSVTLAKGDRIQLWPNVKREGHEATDADFSVAVVAEKVAA